MTYRRLKDWQRKLPGSTIEHGPNCTPKDMGPADDEGIRDCFGCGLWEEGYRPNKEKDQ